MKQLPKYAFLSNSEFVGRKVMSLMRPYFIASVYEVSQENREEYMEDMVQGRFPMSKVRGYSIFLKPYSSLEPCSGPEHQQSLLNEMADFVLEDLIQRKPGKFRCYDESGRSEKVHERAKQHAMRMRGRKANG